jgi:hypothetical protein
MLFTSARSLQPHSMRQLIFQAWACGPRCRGFEARRKIKRPCQAKWPVRGDAPLPVVAAMRSGVRL